LLTLLRMAFCEGGYFWFHRQLINKWTEIKLSLSHTIKLIRKHNFMFLLYRNALKSLSGNLDQ
jgi:hypothetical protein